jgi:hypothetical protein
VRPHIAKMPQAQPELKKVRRRFPGTGVDETDI